MLWEFKLGIDSRGIVHSSAQSDYHHYSTISYHEIMMILRSLSFRLSDAFVDIGCGKGRVLCCASRFRIQEVIGIEIDNELCAIAQRNARKVRSRKSSITIINDAAENFDYRAGTVYYLFNPFGVSTLRRVLEKMKQSVQFWPRNLRIVYVNSVHESVLGNSHWLEMYDKWKAGEKLALMHDVSFWRLKD